MSKVTMLISGGLIYPTMSDKNKDGHSLDE